MIALKVDIISRETIKPSSPTPPHHRKHDLSLLDQLHPSIYVPVILFFTKENEGVSCSDIHERSNRLKKSLSETLTRFYPLAGRLKDNITVDCNDEGAYYMEARIDNNLSEVLGHPNTELPRSFLPNDHETMKLAEGYLLLIQFNIFSCGGIAVGINVSHKIMDASSVCLFLSSWAATASEDCILPIYPVFVGATLLPPLTLSGPVPRRMVEGRCLTRRYVFTASKIASLKAAVRAATGTDPTRVEAVSSLILRCANSAARSKLDPPRHCMFSQSVNIRQRMFPPLSKNTVGNLAWMYSMLVKEEEVLELHDVVDQMRKGMKGFCDRVANKLKGEQGSSFILRGWGKRLNDVNCYYFNSWCRFPFYETDFGWGKPSWVSSASYMLKNYIFLMDTKLGDGIEAWVTLEEDDMAIFERSDEISEFAVCNPCL